MLDLSKKVLPSSIQVDGSIFPIHTDFQYWLKFNALLKTNELKLLTDFDFLYKEIELASDTDLCRMRIPQNRQAGLDELIKFNNPENPLPKDVGLSGNGAKLLDFEIDADLIYAAFYEQYKIDLMEPDLHLHWHKFLALLDGLHGTRLNDIESYRAYTPDNMKHEQLMRRLQQAWSLENILTPEEQKALDEFDALLK